VIFSAAASARTRFGAHSGAVRSWLALKGLRPVAGAPGVHRCSRAAHLVADEHRTHGSRSLRYRTERKIHPRGNGSTTVTVIVDGVDEDWDLGRCQRAPSTTRTDGLT